MGIRGIWWVVFAMIVHMGAFSVQIRVATLQTAQSALSANMGSNLILII